MNHRWSILLAVPLACLGLTACDTGKEEDSGVICADPIASAGPDQGITLGATVTLDGTGSTICESTLETATFNWSFEQVPVGSAVDNSSLSDNATNSASAPSFVPDTVGTYVISLVVSDGNGDSPADLMVVTVESGDTPPVADAGPDLMGTEDEETIFDGSASYDPEGAELEFVWALSSVPSCSALENEDLHNNATSTPSIVPDCAGSFVVSLVVGDGIHWSDPDFAYLTVGDANEAPVPDAGESQELGGCAPNPLPLNGFASYDPDGDALTDEWSLYSAPAGSAATDADFDDVSLPDPSFSWDIAGSYTFQLQVYDGTIWSEGSLVTVLIDEEGNNRSPIANAGDDMVISVEADCTSQSYLWTCDDCSASTIELDGAASSDPDDDILTYTWAETTRTVSFSAPNSAITRVTVPAQPATYGSAVSTQFEVSLTVEDCAESDVDTMVIDYSCEGVAE